MSKITIDRAVVEQALKLLDALSYDENYDYDGCFQHWADYARPEKLVLQFRAAMEQTPVKIDYRAECWPESPHYRPQQPQVEQEPVAEITGMDEYGPMLGWHKHWAEFPVGTKLYLHPQPPRQPLTDQQIHDCFQHRHRDRATERRMITRAIEEAIWKKNS